MAQDETRPLAFASEQKLQTRLATLQRSGGQRASSQGMGGFAVSLQSTPHQNRLLGALPPDAQARIFPHLEPVALPLNAVLCESGEDERHAWFPTNAIVSLVYVMENGASAETCMVGNDGMIGLALFMGGNSTSTRAVVESAGFAWRLSGQRLREETERHAGFLQLLLRYTQSLITQTAQTSVCNRHHSIEQRFCRRLLLCLDRIDGNEMLMTQELIAGMLGVRREGITEAAGHLQKLGIIQYSRGHIHVIDRTRLEAASCECYSVISRELARLVPPLSPQTILPIRTHLPHVRQRTELVSMVANNAGSVACRDAKRP